MTVRKLGSSAAVDDRIDSAPGTKEVTFARVILRYHIQILVD